MEASRKHGKVRAPGWSAAPVASFPRILQAGAVLALDAVQVCSDKCACGEQMWVNCEGMAGLYRKQSLWEQGEALLPHPARVARCGGVVEC